MKTVRLFFAWLWITLPLAWGVYSSAKKAAPLFQSSGQAAVQSPSPPPVR
jgi:hypothetical protein